MSEANVKNQYFLTTEKNIIYPRKYNGHETNHGIGCSKIRNPACPFPLFIYTSVSQNSFRAREKRKPAFRSKFLFSLLFFPRRRDSSSLKTKSLNWNSGKHALCKELKGERGEGGRGGGSENGGEKDGENRDITDVTTFKRSPSSRGLVPFFRNFRKDAFMWRIVRAKGVFFFDIARKEISPAAPAKPKDAHDLLLILWFWMSYASITHPPPPPRHGRENRIIFFPLLSTYLHTYIFRLCSSSSFADLSACSFWTWE